MVKGNKRGPERNHVFWTWQNCSTHKLTAAVIACTRLLQDQASQHPSMEREGVKKPPLLGSPADLMVSVKGESQFSLRCSSW